jgi:DNA polymerase-3 subunit gamma/tau
MSYQVIARKYRPQRFEDVVGQEHVTRTLSQAIVQHRIAHAYLFCGPRGTGKTTIARIFAKCLNATGGPRVDFEDNDPRCNEITEGRSLDVLEIDGASNNGVEQVRELRETCRYAPASSKFKIYIIDEVHMLSAAAFNALLKTLEEPPEHVKFLFATTDPEKVLPTILSRCQRFDLRQIPAKLIADHLTYIAGKEKVEVSPAALYAIARGAEGGMRDAESTLDQLISFCGTTIEESDVLSMFGLTAQNQLLELSGAVLSGDVEAALRQLNLLTHSGKDLGRLVTDLLNHFRNLLIFQVSKGDLSMLEISEAEASALAEQAKLVPSEGVTRILEVLGDTEMRLRDAASKKILIEVALFKASEARHALSVDSLLKQLQALRQGTPPGAGPATPRAAAPEPARPSTRVTPPTPAVPPAPQSRAPINPPAEIARASVAAVPAIPSPLAREPEPLSPLAAPLQETPPAPLDLSQLWSSLVEGVGRESPFTRSYLLEAHPVSLTKTLFTIGFLPEFAEHIPLVDNPRNQKLIQDSLAALGHPGLLIKFVKAEAARSPAPASGPSLAATAPVPKPSATPRPAPSAIPASGSSTKPAAAIKSAPPPSAKLSQDDFKNDPLILKALEVFKGQIVDVRT